MRLNSSLILSISAPLRPITTPGRAVKMVMRQRVAARSIRIFGTEADSSFFFSTSRICRSSLNSFPNSFLPAYHLERQSLVTPTRRPIGLVFCPITLFALAVGNDNLDVAAALDDWPGRTTRLGGEPFDGS